MVLTNPTHAQCCHRYACGRIHTADCRLSCLHMHTHKNTCAKHDTNTHAHTDIHARTHTHTHTHTQQVSIVPADIAEAEEEYGDEEEEVRMILLPHGCVAPNFSCSCFANTENKGVTSMAW